MDTIGNQALSHPVRLALGYCSPDLRALAYPAFALDARLATLVSKAHEPVLGQMRLAWWRDTLSLPAQQRPKGDRVLDGMSQHWRGQEQGLIAMVDGWEHLLAQSPIPREDIMAYAAGRAELFAALARFAGAGTAQDNTRNTRNTRNAHNAGAIWAMADLYGHLSDDNERMAVLKAGQELTSHRAQLPYSLRSLAILGSLGRRVLQDKRPALIGGRRDIALVLRIGLFGR